ncbi:hypothetical protein EJB05_54728, partial [Eragrostis curvula]
MTAPLLARSGREVVCGSHGRPHPILKMTITEEQEQQIHGAKQRRLRASINQGLPRYRAGTACHASFKATMEVPYDILSHILERIDSHISFIHAAAVCKLCVAPSPAPTSSANIAPYTRMPSLGITTKMPLLNLI